MFLGLKLKLLMLGAAALAALCVVVALYRAGQKAERQATQARTLIRVRKDQKRREEIADEIRNDRASSGRSYADRLRADWSN